LSYDFSESEELTILRQTIKDFSQKEISAQAHNLDEKELFSYELTEKMGELGLLGMIVPTEEGGHGLDYLSYISAVEELAAVDSSQAATIAAHNSLGVNPIHYYGSSWQKKKFIPQLCDGKGLWAFGLTEPGAGSDAQATSTTAKWDKQKEEWILNGSKLWITNSATKITKGITVQAVTGVQSNSRLELSCFLIPADSPGLKCSTMHGKMMWRSSNTGEVFLDNVRVPQKYMLGER
jgi:short-chain 2-methylacyl-CoA dehydrogenase